jgi:hypothetical protein
MPSPITSINSECLSVAHHLAEVGDLLHVLVERPRPVPRRPNRTADMNVQEKSDCAVVPVNQPNKERLLSAEAGEERTQTKENIVQSHIRPTQSGERMSQGLRGVCDKQQEKGSRNVSPLCFTKITMERRE